MKYATVYKMTMPNGKSYVGVTEKDLNVRFIRHKCKARQEKSKLYKEFIKHDYSKIRIEEIEKCPVIEKYKREKFWIEKLDTFKNGLNSSVGGAGPKKRKRSSSEVNASKRGRLKTKNAIWVENKKTGQCHGMWSNKAMCSRSLGIHIVLLHKIRAGKKSNEWSIKDLEITHGGI